MVTVGPEGYVIVIAPIGCGLPPVFEMGVEVPSGTEFPLLSCIEPDLYTQGGLTEGIHWNSAVYPLLSVTFTVSPLHRVKVSPVVIFVNVPFPPLQCCH